MAYVPLDFTEVEQQVLAYQPVLYAIIGKAHKMTWMSIRVVKYVHCYLLSSKDSLIEAVWERQAPAMFSYIFHEAVQGSFNEQSNTSDCIDPQDLLGDIRIYNVLGYIYFFQQYQIFLLLMLETQITV